MVFKTKNFSYSLNEEVLQLLTVLTRCSVVPENRFWEVFFIRTLKNINQPLVSNLVLSTSSAEYSVLYDPVFYFYPEYLISV